MIQPAQKAVVPITEFRAQLNQMGGEFRIALPSHIQADKFQRVVMTSVQLNPSLLNADRRTFMASITKCAQDGLLPDGREAAFVIFKTKIKDERGKDKWVQAVQYMPMIAGIHKKIRNSGELSSLTSHVVYENDDFLYELGDEEFIRHKPKLNGPRGNAIAAYAIATLKDGTRIREVMSEEQIEDVRGVSKAKDGGPWVKWWGEMARKTVTRRLSKRLPISTDLETVLKRDDDFYDLNQPHKATVEQLTSRPTLEGASRAITDETSDQIPAEVIDQQEPEEDAGFDNPPRDAPRREDVWPDDGKTQEGSSQASGQAQGYCFVSMDGEVLTFDNPGEFAAAIVSAAKGCSDARSLEGLRDSNQETIKILPDYLLEQIEDVFSPTQTKTSAGIPETAISAISNAIRNSQNEKDLDHRLRVNEDSFRQMSNEQRTAMETLAVEVRNTLRKAGV